MFSFKRKHPQFFYDIAISQLRQRIAKKKAQQEWAETFS